MLTWLRVAANYLTPFLVSNAGVLAAGRDRNAKEGPGDPGPSFSVG